MADRSQDFMTILLGNELVVLPCANLDHLLEQWLADDGRAFTQQPWILLDEVPGHWDHRVSLMPPPAALAAAAKAPPAA